MALSLRVGSSSSDDVDHAVAEAVGAASRGAERPTFALLLCTDRYPAELFAAAVNRELGSVPWAGCCCAGVFAGTQLLEHGVVCGVFTTSTDDTSFAVGIGGPVSVDARAAGAEAARQAVSALRRPGQRGATSFIILPGVLTGNASDVVRGALQAVGAGSVWAGGGGGDNLRFVQNAQFAFGQSWRDRVVVVAIEGPLPIAVGIKHGWRPYGPAVTVTRSSGVTANELDYESAFLVYRRIAATQGDEIDERAFAQFAMRHPLGIPQANGEFVIRDPLAVQPDGSLRCVAEVPEGAIVRVMQGDRDELLEAAGGAATEARTRLNRAPGGAIVFDCVSRRSLLGSDFEDELAVLQGAIGADVPLMGCLTFGEIGALGGEPPQFHNKAAVVVALPGAPRAATQPSASPARAHAPSETHEETLTIASTLQELTVAALELFDPDRSPDPFLDRVAERLGCYAILLVELDAPGVPRLAGASGISTASRRLPLSDARSAAGEEHASLPYPELADPTLVRWWFPIAAQRTSAELLLVFLATQPLSARLHGMVERLARTLGTVLLNRRLFAHAVESEREVAIERDAAAAARAAAERADRAKGEFLAVVSHEIRNNLNPVLAWTRMLRTRDLTPEQMAHGLEVIERNARLQSRLVEDLLDLDRGGSAAFRITRMGIDLVRLVREEAEIIGLEAARKGIALDVTAEGGAATVSGDADRLRQVFANLLQNAVKFTPAGGRIDVITARQGAIVRVDVRDSGRGIPREVLPDVFDAFRRGAASLAAPVNGSRGSGLGIGLAVVRRIVEAHDGTVSADSPGPGQGSTFTVELPAAQ